MQNTLRTSNGLEHLNTAWLCSGFSILNLQPGDVSQHKDANMYGTTPSNITHHHLQL